MLRVDDMSEAVSPVQVNQGNVPATKGKVLYFEDDLELSNLFKEFLETEHYQVIHYAALPEGGIAEIAEALGDQPDFVLLDIGLPGVDGNQVCQQLRDEYLSANVPIIFISGRMSEKDILSAYEVGADDYLIKPVRLMELKLKLEQFSKRQQARENNQQLISGAQQMAFKAMATSSELGEILRFHEDSYSVNSIADLAKLLLDAIAKFSLKASVAFFDKNTEFYRNDGQTKPLEEQALETFRDQERIFSWKNRTFFNYPNFSLLIRDMPINDEERYGVLKDQLCLLFNGVDARVNALKVEKSNQMKAITMRIAADTIANMVMEMENDNVELSKKFEEIILKMEADISADIIQFNLLENEESVLLNHIMEATNQSSQIFEASLEKEKQYSEIMTKLLKELLHGT